MDSETQLPQIPAAEQTPLVMALVQVCAQQQEQITQQQEQISQQRERIHLLQEQVQALKDEIARLKGNSPKPKIEPSKLDKSRDKKKRKRKTNRPGSAKRSKTRNLQIHETVKVPPKDVPEGSRFKGYEDYTVQDIKFCSHNTTYRLERWETPEGATLMGKLPDEVSVGHFGITLISGSTRSERGRRCRDTFASIKKTCRKLGVSFWFYLKDRISGQDRIALLPDLIRQRAEEVFT